MPKRQISPNSKSVVPERTTAPGSPISSGGDSMNISPPASAPDAGTPKNKLKRGLSPNPSSGPSPPRDPDPHPNHDLGLAKPEPKEREVINNSVPVTVPVDQRQKTASPIKSKVNDEVPAPISALELPASTVFNNSGPEDQQQQKIGSPTKSQRVNVNDELPVDVLDSISPNVLNNSTPVPVDTQHKTASPIRSKVIDEAPVPVGVLEPLSSTDEEDENELEAGEVSQDSEDDEGKTTRTWTTVAAPNGLNGDDDVFVSTAGEPLSEPEVEVNSENEDEPVTTRKKSGEEKDNEVLEAGDDKDTFEGDGDQEDPEYDFVPDGEDDDDEILKGEEGDEEEMSGEDEGEGEYDDDDEEGEGSYFSGSEEGEADDEMTGEGEGALTREPQDDASISGRMRDEEEGEVDDDQDMETDQPVRKRARQRSEVVKPEPSTSTEIDPDFSEFELTLQTSRNAKYKFFDEFYYYFSELELLPPDSGQQDLDELMEESMEHCRTFYELLDEDELVEKQTLLDQILREYLLEYIITDGILKKTRWESLVEFSIKFAREEQATPIIPITLMTDLVELSDLDDCERVFNFIESQLETWKEPFFMNSGKNAVLRLCNDLLRRLSREQNTLLCGRILIFLSDYFPFSERSGLNIMSEFNTDNATVFKTGDGSDDPEDQLYVGDQSKHGKLFEGVEIKVPGLHEIIADSEREKEKQPKLTYALYVEFWSLQDYFKNPSQCYTEVGWTAFLKYVHDVLEALNSFKLEPPPEKDQESDLDHAPRASLEPSELFNLAPTLGNDRLYFAKYLTNRRLLELELKDGIFRRYFLIQLLIVLQYLTLPVKFKGENQVLTEEQLECIDSLKEKVFHLLDCIPPEGKTVSMGLRNMFKREELWSKWKNDGCPEFKKPEPPANVGLPDENLRTGSDLKVGTEPAGTEKMETDQGTSAFNNEGMLLGSEDRLPEIPGSSANDLTNKPAVPRKKVRRRLGNVLMEAEKKGKWLLGNPELNRLWNKCSDNLEACRKGSRDFMPSIEGHFAESFKELDTDPIPPPPKKQLKPKKILGDPNFGWRSLRLLARRSPYFFQTVSSSPLHPLQVYLEFILRKIAADLNITIPTNAAQALEKAQPEKVPAPVVKQANDGAKNEAAMEVDTGAEGQKDSNQPLPEATQTQDDERVEYEEDKQRFRCLTEDEQGIIGKRLGDDWKKLALKLGFKPDEVEYFETDHKESAGAYMLQMWTLNEAEDATVAELLYTMEGLGLKDKTEGVFNFTT